MKPLIPPRLLAALLALPAPAAQAQEADDQAFQALYGEESAFISIATGTRKAIHYAPAVAGVITAEEIAAMGARDLDEALESVPGLHVSYFMTGYSPIYTIRGVRADTNPQVLMLINGIPATHLFYGDRGRIWGGMPVKAIARIEVLRGPGSALYGADALAGVINVVTKGVDELEGSEVGAHVGSFDERGAWFSHGGALGEAKIAFTLEANRTDGHGETIPSDSQSGLDAVIGLFDPGNTPISLAPGPVNLGREQLEMRFELAYERWRLRAGYQGRYEVESGAGGAGALDPWSRYRAERVNADLTYHDAQLIPDWDITAQASLLHSTQEGESPFVLFPPGADFSLLGGGGPFADGVLGQPDISERHLRLSLAALYSGLEGHRVQLGAGWSKGELYHSGDRRNFASGFAGIPVPLAGGLTDVGGTPDAFLPTGERSNAHLFIQDEWNFADDWELTAGLRYDDYSDVGGTLNPRLALVWQNDYDLTTKLLYGRAFRAPSFAELYSASNPVALGNPNLEPETVDTLELAWDYHPAADWRGTATLFAYEMSDIIQLVDDPGGTSASFGNRGVQQGYGVELEGSWRVSDAFTLRGNFTALRATDDAERSVAGVPERQLYLRGEWSLAPHWALTGQLNWVGEREREAGDGRAPVDDYAVVDLVLRHDRPGEPWGVTLAVKNLFDEKPFEHAPLNAGIPGDLPLAGRGAFAELHYRF